MGGAIGGLSRGYQVGGCGGVCGYDRNCRKYTNEALTTSDWQGCEIKNRPLGFAVTSSDLVAGRYALPQSSINSRSFPGKT